MASRPSNASHKAALSRAESSDVPTPAVAADPGAIDAARLGGLVYVSDRDPGIIRLRSGKGFVYRDPGGTRVRNGELLSRIRSLAIPPAYENVWICVSARGHLQATGRDARARKQYRYHAQWSAVRGDGKFARLVAFGERLPALRRRLRKDLALPALPREKVLAVVVSLLAETLARIGNEQYARSNRSFGLTTLRERHIAFLRSGRAQLRFKGKSGQAHDITIDNARLIRVLRRCQQLPGQALFQYVDDEGVRQPIDSGMVNDYLREAMGETFTAKDFRTWGGTLRAIALMARLPLPESGGERALALAISGVVKEVAGHLRNTPAVCRGSYIHPEVFEAWRDGTLARIVPGEASVHPRQLESMALRLLKMRARHSARKRGGKSKPLRTQGA